MVEIIDDFQDAMTRQIIILAAGKGTRMGSPIPKVLIPLDDKPVISHLLEEVARVEKQEPPIVVVGFQHELVRETLGDNFLYALQLEQKGTAHAVLSARSLVSADNIIVLYGDMPFVSASSISQLINLHEDKQARISMFTASVPSFEGDYGNFNGFGRIIRSETGSIEQIKEFADASYEERSIQEINPGIYMFSSEWLWPRLERIGRKNAQGEFYLTDIVEIAIDEGTGVNSIAIAPEEIFGINTPEHLAHALLLKQK